MDLYNFAANTRRAILYGALGLVALFVLWIVYRFAVNLYLTLNPPPETPPTVGFGKLPKLRLPALSVEGNPIYLLETPTGDLPALPDRIQVVMMTPVQPTLLGEEKARELADQLDFGGRGELSANREELTFRDEIDKRTLTVNVVTQNFTLSTDTDRIALLPLGRAISGPDAVKESQGILNRLGLLKFGFAEGSQTTAFNAASDGAVEEVGSISEAHFTQVSFFRSLTEVASQSYLIMPPDPKVGLIQVGTTSDLNPVILNTLSISYKAQEVGLEKTEVETYPLENVATAWEQVKQGSGVVHVEISEELSSISITKVYLAYFDDPVHQKYLQPIYVFSGVAKTGGGKEGEFFAYVPAISAEWISE